MTQDTQDREAFEADSKRLRDEGFGSSYEWWLYTAALAHARAQDAALLREARQELDGAPCWCHESGDARRCGKCAKCALVIRIDTALAGREGT